MLSSSSGSGFGFGFGFGSGFRRRRVEDMVMERRTWFEKCVEG